jgi:hypothetical protein
MSIFGEFWVEEVPDYLKYDKLKGRRSRKGRKRYEQLNPLRQHRHMTYKGKGVIAQLREKK